MTVTQELGDRVTLFADGFFSRRTFFRNPASQSATLTVPQTNAFFVRPAGFTGTSYTIVFTGLAMVAVVVVLWLSRRVRSLGWAIALGFLLGGVSGNLTDRIFRAPEPFRGHVVDLLMLPNWPVFNVADVWINIAAGLIILQTFRGVALDGTRDADRPDASTATKA